MYDIVIRYRNVSTNRSNRVYLANRQKSNNNSATSHLKHKHQENIIIRKEVFKKQSVQVFELIRSMSKFLTGMFPRLHCTRTRVKT